MFRTLDFRSAIDFIRIVLWRTTHCRRLAIQPARKTVRPCVRMLTLPAGQSAFIEQTEQIALRLADSRRFFCGGYAALGAVNNGLWLRMVELKGSA
ncbi:hypothetical protein NXC24_PC00492 (plasmid) [Rhizobium sp. NXC24]|nr:hypothetical protein NXC24_PC00492 [Rhizobium sp. NXC24]